MNNWMVLFAGIMLGSGCYAGENEAHQATNAGSTVLETGNVEEYGLHVVKPELSGLRKYLDQMKLMPRVSSCENWSDREARVGMLLSVPGTSRLFIGKPTVGVGVSDLERNYEVTNATIRGSPLEGNVTVRLAASEIERERVCLEKLVGVAIQWAGPRGTPDDQEFEGEVIVEDIQFSRLAQLNSDGDLDLTGAFAAKLKVSESWMSMVLRKMKEHVWEIVGGALLTATLGIVGWPVRRGLKKIGQWRKRFRIEIAWFFTTCSERGNEIIIRNLGDRPVILIYWELLWVSGWRTLWKKTPFRLPEEEIADVRIDAQSSYKLLFAEADHFAWGPTDLRGRKIYIRLWFAGRRRTVLRRVWG